MVVYNNPAEKLMFWSDMLVRFQIMIVVIAGIIFFASMFGKKSGNVRPRGVAIFGILLIFASIYKLWGFLNYDYYKFMFQQLPDQAIPLRYMLSIALRIAGLGIGIGLLSMKDIFRKIFLLLSLCTLCLIYWKHPFFVFENIAMHAERQFFGSALGEALTYPMYPWISMAFIYLVDIIFSGSALYYFTRPKVKAQFH